MSRDPNELGALWVKSGRKGEYMTGNINGVGVVLFRNDRKEPGSKQPDWRVLKAEKRERDETTVNEVGVQDRFEGDDPPF